MIQGSPAATRLDTPRLRLRPLVESDWPAYARMCGDVEVMRHIGSGAAQSKEEAWRSMAMFLGHWTLRGHGMYALEHRDSGTLLGRAGFHEPAGWPGFELGWLLAREHWGFGYAREAAATLLRHAFDDMRRDRVISLIRPDNTRSVAVAAAIGETLHGQVDLLGSTALVYEARP